MYIPNETIHHQVVVTSFSWTTTSTFLHGNYYRYSGTSSINMNNRDRRDYSILGGPRRCSRLSSSLYYTGIGNTRMMMAYSNNNSSSKSSSKSKSKKKKSSINNSKKNKKVKQSTSLSSKQKQVNVKQIKQIKQIKQKRFTNEEIKQMPIGQAIQESTTIQQLLNITASRMWIPTDENLSIHIRQQVIHHEKRFRYSSLLLDKLSNMIIHIMSSCSKTSCSKTIRPNDEMIMLNLLWNDNHDFKRVILAATLPFQSTSLHKHIHDDNNSSVDSIHSGIHSGISYEKECRFVSLTLVALYTIAGYTSIHNNNNNTRSTSGIHNVDKDIIKCIQILIERAEILARTHFTLHQAIQTRWAIRGLYNYIPQLSSSICSTTLLLPNLNHRVRKLPFDIIPQCINWNNVQKEYNDHYETNNNNDDNSDNNKDEMDVIQLLLQEIPFQYDTITTRNGSLVQERRKTAWLAETDIGSLAYSGKLMNPYPIPSFIQYTMRELEKNLLKELVTKTKADNNNNKNDKNDNHGSKELLEYTTQQLQLCIEENGKYFDCILTNHYPNYDSACKFHTDPEHGTYWERLTCVLSAGNNDIRKFAFRPIPQLHNNDWSKWENNNEMMMGSGSNGVSSSSNIEPVFLHLFPGDCVMMWGSCNDVFDHAVYGADHEILGNNDEDNNDTQLLGHNHNDGRVSLVFKKAIIRSNGRKGHGLLGEGRRSRKK